MVTEALAGPARHRLAAAVLGLGLLFTGLAWAVPGFDVAYGSEGMHIALAAIAGTVALATGWVAWARYTRSGSAGDLAVAVAFGLVIFGEDVFAFVLPTLLHGELLRPSSVWIASILECVASVLLLGGALARARRLGRVGAVVFLVLVGVVVSAAVGAVLGLGSGLSLPIDPGLSPLAPHRQVFAGEAAMLAMQAASGLLLLLAGAACVLRRDDDDALLGWLGPALIVAALAAGNYALFPSLYSYWIYAGDGLQLAFCALLACGVAAELRAAVRRAIDLSVLEERRRLARALHDGLAQELAFMARELDGVPDEAHPSLRWVRSSVDRALYESRRAINALTVSFDRPLADLLLASVEEIAARESVELDVDADARVAAPSPAVQEAVLGIAHEVVTNAVRHGNPTTVAIRLRQTPCSLVLEIADDGCGFDIPAVPAGFGLTCMRERAESSGGVLALRTAVGHGVHVEASWPSDPQERRRSAPVHRAPTARAPRAPAVDGSEERGGEMPPTVGHARFPGRVDRLSNGRPAAR